VVALLLVLWYAGPVVKAVAAYRLWRNQLIRRFPILWVSIVVSMVTSIVLLFFRRDPTIYTHLYSYSTPIGLLLETFAIVGVFWTVAEHYPSFRGPGSALLGALALIGGVAGWLTRFAAVPAGWSGIWEAAILIQRHVTLLMSIVLIGTRLLLPRVRGIPIRPSAARTADIITAHVVVCAMGSAFTVATAARYPLVTAYVPVVAGLVTATLFATCLTGASDQCGTAELVSEHEIKAYMARHERNWELLRQASAGHLKEIE
jgi:hypothetical protein